MFILMRKDHSTFMVIFELSFRILWCTHSGVNYVFKYSLYNIVKSMIFVGVSYKCTLIIVVGACLEILAGFTCNHRGFFVYVLTLSLDFIICPLVCPTHISTLLYFATLPSKVWAMIRIFSISPMGIFSCFVQGLICFCTCQLDVVENRVSILEHFLCILEDF